MSTFSIKWSMTRSTTCRLTYSTPSYPICQESHSSRSYRPHGPFTAPHATTDSGSNLSTGTCHGSGSYDNSLRINSSLISTTRAHISGSTRRPPRDTLWKARLWVSLIEDVSGLLVDNSRTCISRGKVEPCSAGSMNAQRLFSSAASVCRCR